MKYFKLMFDYENYDKRSVFFKCKDMHGIDRYIFDEGKKIDKWPNFTFYYNPNEDNEFIDYQGNELVWFTISSKFKKIIEDLGSEGVQFLPIKIVNEKDNSINTDFFVVNVYNRIEALDYENTKYIGTIPKKEDFEKNPLKVSVRIYALREDKIKGLNIFRIKEQKFAPIFVSEAFKKAVEKNKITGCDFGKVIVA